MLANKRPGNNPSTWILTKSQGYGCQLGLWDQLILDRCSDREEFFVGGQVSAHFVRSSEKSENNSPCRVPGPSNYPLKWVIAPTLQGGFPFSPISLEAIPGRRSAHQNHAPRRCEFRGFVRLPAPARKLSSMPIRLAAIWKPPWKSCGAVMGPEATESQSKPGIKMVVIPEPCKEFRRRPQLFLIGIVPY